MRVLSRQLLFLGIGETGARRHSPYVVSCMIPGGCGETIHGLDRRTRLGTQETLGRRAQCSQIAKQLGGVTRNAVIGKVHRLGLSGRATPSRPVKRPPRLARPKPTASGGWHRRRRRRAAPAPAPPPRTRPSRNHRAEANVEPQPLLQWRHGHRPHRARLDVQMADRRSRRPEIRLLRPRQVRELPLLRRTRPGRLPAGQKARTPRPRVRLHPAPRRANRSEALPATAPPRSSRTPGRFRFVLASLTSPPDPSAASSCTSGRRSPASHRAPR